MKTFLSPGARRAEGQGGVARRRAGLSGRGAGVARRALAALSAAFAIAAPVVHAVAASAASAADGDAPVTLENQTFPGHARIAGAELGLNGVGLRAAFIYKVYLAGLYLPTKASTGADVMAETGPKRLQVRLLMDGPSDEFAKAFTGGIEKRTPAPQVAAMKDRIEAFDHTLRTIGDVHKGDVVNLDFTPDVGLTMTLNGKPVGRPVPGADLYAALLDIFVGDRPVDGRMKAGLLGAAPG